MEPTQKQITENCDAVIFSSTLEPETDKMHTKMRFIRAKNDQTKRSDLGHKYNVLLLRGEDTAEMFSAIIGDPKGYIERIGRLGYGGIMLKVGALNITEDFDLIDIILTILAASKIDDENRVKFLFESVD